MRLACWRTSSEWATRVLFNSYVFMLVFLPLALLGWWGLRGKRARLIFLTGASYVFYGWWDYRFVPLMIASTTADYIAGGRIYRATSKRERTVWLVGLLAFNLGILGFFKYYDFFAGSLNGLASTLGFDPWFPLLHIVLPIGISFYTFNSISYTIDIYRGRLAPARSPLEFSAFVAMFPHLVAGPIVRYADMDDQFRRLPERPTGPEWTEGIWFFVLGLAKKVLIADTVAAGLVTPFFARTHELQFFDAWGAALAYTVQIYFDFSGYSDMAVGLALLLGIRFPQNFDSPYKAENISAFWRRWHMSLSFWLRDYLFISLGGSRGTIARTARNLGITMFLGGLWHGAGWTFVVWGFYHGALLAGHAVAKRRGWVPGSRTVATTLTFVAVVVGWVLFRADTIGQAGAMLSAMAGARGFGGLDLVLGHERAFAFTLLGLAIAFLLPNTWEIRFPRTRTAAVAAASLVVLCMLQFATPSPFLYFQF